MARVSTILLMLVYAFTATGGAVHLHYCCGKLQKFAVEQEKSPGTDSCPLCLTHNEKKKEKAGDCCGEDPCGDHHGIHSSCQHVTIDAQETTGDHLPSSDKNPVKIYPLQLLAFAVAYFNTLPTDTLQVPQFVGNAPPGATIPLFIQHCTYRI